MKTYKFKKGDTYSLDLVYDLIGIIPLSSYEQDDIADSRYYGDPDNDCGESVRFIKNVTIKIDIKVS